MADGLRKQPHDFERIVIFAACLSDSDDNEVVHSKDSNNIEAFSTVDKSPFGNESSNCAVDDSPAKTSSESSGKFQIEVSSYFFPLTWFKY